MNHRCLKTLPAVGLASAVLLTATAMRPSAAVNLDTPRTDIVFDVERKGEIIGTHRVSFRDIGAGENWRLGVEARFDIAIPFLIFDGYTYTYESSAEWATNGLWRLNARIDDNGDVWQVSAVRQDDKFVVHGPDGVTVTPAPIYPTDHWHPGVLDQTRVLNTITGTIDNVTIAPVGEAEVVTEAGKVTATRYRYTGDLTTEVLYDRRGRWVGMTFEGKDGTAITYRCHRCQSGTQSTTDR